MNRPDPLEIAQSMNATLKECFTPESMHSDCSGKIIKAHTVSKSASLQEIAYDQHLYTFKTHPVQQFKNAGKAKINKIGINKASTFTGFCGGHDRSLFEPLDNQNFDFTLEQVFLAGYRSLCHELHAKKIGIENIKNARSKMTYGKTPSEQKEEQEFFARFQKSFELAESDLTQYKNILDSMLLSNDFSKIKYIGFECDKVIPIMGASAITPMVDFANNTIQVMHHKKKTIENIFYTSFASNGKGIFLMYWVDDFGSISEQYADSLWGLSNKEISNMIINIMITHSENIYIAIPWWDNLDLPVKKKLTKAFNDTLRNPILDYEKLRDLDIADWNVIQRYDRK